MDVLRAAANVASKEAHDERACRATLVEAFMRRIVAQRGRIDLGPDDIRAMDIAEGALLAVRTDSGNTAPRARSVLMFTPQAEMQKVPATGEHNPAAPGAATEFSEGKTLPIGRPAPKAVA